MINTLTLTDGRVMTATPGPEHTPTWATCGECGLRWDDALSTSVTPSPSGRCPNEYDHDPRGNRPRVTTWADGFGTWHARVSMTATGAHAAEAVAVAAIAAEIAARAPRGAAPHVPTVKLAERATRGRGRVTVHYIETD